MDVRIKRVYDESSPDDGYRVLIDKFWPRGVTKDSLLYDEWNREIAPSDEARKAFAHQDDKFPAFREQYLAELEQNPAASDFRARLVAQDEPVTLLIAAKNLESNHALVLKEYLNRC